MDGGSKRAPIFVKGQKRSGHKAKNGDSVKVVYISTPMKVKTSASRFRSLVQELTGKNSDVSHYMEDNNYTTFDHDFHDIDQSSLAKETGDKYSENTPTSSDSLLEPMDGVFSTRIMDEQFFGILANDCFSMSSPLPDNGLGSYYGELL